MTRTRAKRYVEKWIKADREGGGGDRNGTPRISRGFFAKSLRPNVLVVGIRVA